MVPKEEKEVFILDAAVLTNKVQLCISKNHFLSSSASRSTSTPNSLKNTLLDGASWKRKFSMRLNGNRTWVAQITQRARTDWGEYQLRIASGLERELTRRRGSWIKIKRKSAPDSTASSRRMVQISTENTSMSRLRLVIRIWGFVPPFEGRIDHESRSMHLCRAVLLTIQSYKVRAKIDEITLRLGVEVGGGGSKKQIRILAPS